MNMRKAMISRLHSRAGESIAEVLIALLISSLGMMMLAGMVSTSKTLVERSKTAFEDSVDKSNALTTGEASNSSSGTVQFYINDKNRRLTDALGETDSVRIDTVTFGRDTVMAYKKQ